MPAPGPTRRRFRPRTASARSLALEILEHTDATARDADLTIQEGFDRVRMAPRDKALVTELVYGVLRLRGRYDWMLRHLSTTPLDKLDPPLPNILRLGLHQLERLQRVPAYAAINESVRLARFYAPAGTSGLVNAVLRRAARDRERLPWPDPSSDPPEHLAVTMSHPRWLVERWSQRLGLDAAARLCALNNEPPPITVRVNTLRATTAQAIEGLKAEGTEAVPIAGHPDALHLASERWITDAAAFREGLVYIQDLTAMTVAPFVAPLPGDAVLDLCAAPGGKATHAAQLMRNEGFVLAVDRAQHKAALILRNALRLGTSIVRPLVADARSIPDVVRGTPFDRVLIDVPCSNTGVLRRRVEARWHIELEDLRRLADLQHELILAGARVLKPGGTLVYSTCSLEPEENSAVVTGFLAERPDFVLDTERLTLPQSHADGGYIARLFHIPTRR